MDEQRPAASGRRIVVFYAAMLLLPFAVLGLLYAALTLYRTADIYYELKTSRRGWKGQVHAPDPELGMAPVPNARGAHLFPIGPDIPMRYDANGFRVPLDPVSDPPPPGPRILTLGCSYTYGDATYAKDTYPQLLAKALDGVALNAGVCSYGLAQMYLLAGKLVPIHRPDYVVVQYSPWLVERARRAFGPSYFGRLPTPYFYERDHGFAVHPPVFRARFLELPIGAFRYTPVSDGDFATFSWAVALPLLLYDDLHMLEYRIDRIVGRVPRPTRAVDGLVEFVYAGIDEVARDNGAKMVVVLLGNSEEPVEMDRRRFPPDALVVDAHGELLDRLPERTREAYRAAYAHWRGSPPVLVDDHPNEDAHRVIAETIAAAMREAGMQ